VWKKLQNILTQSTEGSPRLGVEEGISRTGGGSRAFSGRTFRGRGLQGRQFRGWNGGWGGVERQRIVVGPFASQEKGKLEKGKERERPGRRPHQSTGVPGSLLQVFCISCTEREREGVCGEGRQGSRSEQKRKVDSEGRGCEGSQPVTPGKPRWGPPIWERARVDSAHAGYDGCVKGGKTLKEGGGKRGGSRSAG